MNWKDRLPEAIIKEIAVALHRRLSVKVELTATTLTITLGDEA